MPMMFLSRVGSALPPYEGETRAICAPSPESLVRDPRVHDLEQVLDTNTELPRFVVTGLVADDHAGLERGCVCCTRADGLEG